MGILLLLNDAITLHVQHLYLLIAGTVTSSVLFTVTKVLWVQYNVVNVNFLFFEGLFGWFMIGVLILEYMSVLCKWDPLVDTQTPP